MPSHNLLPPARIVALGGPVSAALAAMRSDPYAADMERLRSLRRAIADRIAADLDLLDALDGDADFEAVNEDGGDICDEPHDPEEDACEEEFEAHGLVSFDGTNYLPIRPSRGGFEPGGLRIVGPDGHDYRVSRAVR